MLGFSLFRLLGFRSSKQLVLWLFGGLRLWEIHIPYISAILPFSYFPPQNSFFHFSHFHQILTSLQISSGIVIISPSFVLMIRATILFLAFFILASCRRRCSASRTTSGLGCPVFIFRFQKSILFSFGGRYQEVVLLSLTVNATLQISGNPSFLAQSSQISRRRAQKSLSLSPLRHKEYHPFGSLKSSVSALFPHISHFVVVTSILGSFLGFS